MNWADEFFQNLRRSAKLQVTSLIVLTGSLFIALALLTIYTNLDSIFSGWTKNLKMTAYLEPGTENYKKILRDITELENIQSAKVVSKEDYKKNFDENLMKALPKLKALQSIENPFHDGIEMQVADLGSMSNVGDLLDKIAKSIEAIAGVSEVSFGKIWLKEYSRLSSFFSYSSIFIIAMILLTLSFIVGNAVKTLLDSRREEIQIMGIIGATNTDIFKPFYINIFLLITSAFILSLTLSSMFTLVIESLFSHHLQVLNISISSPSFLAVFTIYILSLGFSFLGSHFHLLRLHSTRY